MGSTAVNSRPFEVTGPTRTKTFPVMVPFGTITSKRVSVAFKAFVTTFVFPAPSNDTAFSSGLGLNPEPEIVRVVPDAPLAGLISKIFTVSVPGPEAPATANILKWFTSADAARPEGLTIATNSVRVY